MGHGSEGARGCERVREGARGCEGTRVWEHGSEGAWGDIYLLYP